MTILSQRPFPIGEFPLARSARSVLPRASGCAALRERAPACGMVHGRLPRALLMGALLGLAGATGAQEAVIVPEDGGQPMTPDQLEAYIAEQKAELESVVENRSETEARAEDVEARLAEREALLAETRQELESLCREQEEVVPGTLEECLGMLED